MPNFYFFLLNTNMKKCGILLRLLSQYSVLLHSNMLSLLLFQKGWIIQNIIDSTGFKFFTMFIGLTNL